jgi:hypothetical protein
MTSETDYPRQRTVAELLAEHGGGAPTGRRRRRRADDDDEPAAVESPPTPVATDLYPAEPGWAQSEPEPDRSVLREPVPDDPSVGVASSWDTPADWDTSTSWDASAGWDTSSGWETSRDASTDGGYAQPTIASDPPAADPDLRSWSPLPPASPPRPDPPTEQIPLVGDAVPSREVGHTGPMDRLRRATPKWRDALEVVERTDREQPDARPGNGRRPADPRSVAPVERPELDDGGPPTQAGALDLDDLDEWSDDDGYEADGADTDHAGSEDGPARRGRVGVDELPAGIDEADLQPRRRLGRAAAEASSTGPAWALVLTQWIVGALGGAALWVGFRFLWRSLPVVAFTAAALVTIGLIVLVRSLLRSKDWRTTGLAVLVGLLLTVSPVLLVLLDR